MATNYSTATHAAAIINPCSHAATQLRNEQLELMQRESSQATNQVVVATDMGIQSQQREGAIKKCKKRATKRLTKHALRQHPIDAGGVAFVAIENCAICKAKHLCARGINTRIRKRAHHKACPKNLKIRGTSEITGFVNKEAARNLAANRAPIRNKTVDKISSPHQGFFFAHCTNHRCTNRVATTAPRPSTTTVTTRIPAACAGLLTGLSTTAVASASVSTLADPTSPRRELDERMKKLESEGDDYSWLDNKKYPAAIGLMVDYILNLFEHRKPASTAAPAPDTVTKQEAIEKCRAFFRPGSFEFEFQKDRCNAPPSPHYHALEGQTILHVDWKLAFPEVDLLCYNCKIQEGAKKHLLHDRTNFSKRKQLFPIWTHSGLPMWCVVMSCKCEFCDATCAGNDGRLLSLLPGYLATSRARTKCSQRTHRVISIFTKIYPTTWSYL
jgi:hypothetical protein